MCCGSNLVLCSAWTLLAQENIRSEAADKHGIESTYQASFASLGY